MDKHDVAKILDDIAVLLEVQGENPFKVRAFQRAARAIESLDEDIHTVISEDRLQEIPGIGEKIALKIKTLVETGHLPYYEELQKAIPSTILQFLQVPGLGAKKAKILYAELSIKTLEELATACKTNLIAKLPGFGLKSQQKILQSLSRLKTYSARHLWWTVEGIALPILEGFKELKGVERAEIAGSFRRKLETVGDLDFLIATTKPELAMEWFTTQNWVEKIIAKGPTKSSVRLKNGIQAEVRAVLPQSFAFALQYYTGSKEHNITLRHIAHEMGLILNEYGLEPRNPRQKSPFAHTKKVDEQQIYEALGLAYIPPELREDRGEIEAALANNLPKLVTMSDIRGAFHCHTTASDGHNTLEEMCEAAQTLGWEYIGIADHSKSSYQANGLQEDRLFAQIEEIKKCNASKKFSPHIFAGLECDIMTNGSLDFPDDVLQALDYVVVSIHRSFQLNETEMTARLIKAIENPYSTMVGHLTGRLLLRREGYALNVEKVIDACIANDTIVELNAQPMRLDMDWRYWHKAKEKGLKCAINPDAHQRSDLAFVRAGLGIARKGWLEKKDIINTLPLAKVKKLLGKN